MKCAILVLAACSSQAAHVAPDRAAPKPITTAIPTDVIETVALSLDGTAAVTAGGNTIRLWRSFDGVQEPIVVRGPLAKRIALSRAGGFGIAIVDEADNLTVEWFRASGELLDKIAIDGQVLQVVPTATGFIALGTDRRLVAIDPHHAPKVVAPPARIAELVASPTAVLAITNDHDDLIGRWLNPDLSFGAATGALQLPSSASEFSLSPDRQHMVALANDGILYEVFVPTGKRVIDHDHADGAGFLADNTLVRWSGLDLQIGNATHEVPYAHPHSFAVAGSVVAYGAARELGVEQNARAVFLGYRYEMVGGLRASPIGEQILFNETARYTIDRSFRLGEQLTDDDDHVHDRTDFLKISSTQTLTLTPDTMSAHRSIFLDANRELMTDIVDDRINYESTTQLIAEVASDRIKFYELDSGRTYELTEPTAAAHRVYLLDPNLAAGAVAYITGIDKGWVVTRKELEAGKLGVPRVYAQPIRAVDRHGNVHLAGHGQWTIPSPTGDRYAEADPHEIWMYASDGTLLWHIQLELDQLVWSLDGKRLWAYQGSLALIDPATGAIVAQRCGFSFGKRGGQPTFREDVRTPYCD
ncbi:MAG: hypothetical protein QM831_10415 [Kofleriaceae bacterium]